MLTYTGRRNHFGNLTNNTSSANLTLGDTLMNAREKRIVRSYKWSFSERQFTTTTVASQQFYKLPYNYGKLLAPPTVTIGTYKWQPKQAASRAQWDRLNMNTSYSSTYPLWYYIFNGQVGFWPIPSTSSYTITMDYEIAPKDLSIADYTTGTITTIASAGTTVTGSGTAWTTNMAGLFLRITAGTADNSGDGEWYEISSVTNATTLVLVKPYGGNAIAAGSAAYTIGQISVLPEAWQELPIYGACEDYFTSVQPDATKAAIYRTKGKEMTQEMKMAEGSKTSDVTLNDDQIPTDNPNLYIRL